MTFGSWFKKLKEFGNKVKSFVTEKVVPVVKKISRSVHDNIVPVVRAVGNAIGGRAGETIRNISDTAEQISDYGANPEKVMKIWNDSRINELQTPARRKD